MADPALEMKRDFNQKSFNVLGEICDRLRTTDSIFLDEHHLDELRISQSSLDWEPEGQIDLDARFCTPYPSDRFGQILEEVERHPSADPVVWSRISHPGKTMFSVYDQGRLLLQYLNLRLGCPDTPELPAFYGDWMLALVPSMKSDGSRH